MMRSGSRTTARCGTSCCAGPTSSTRSPSQLRDELDAALDAADARPRRAGGAAARRGPGVLRRVRARLVDRGAGERRTAPTGRVWDTVADVQMIGTFGNTFAKLHSISKPTLAAVQGWCIAGGTDMVLNADLIVAGESARFGYPPARVWGVPEAPWVWVARLGLERAKRYLFTGDELTAHRGGRRRDDPRVRARRRAARSTPPRWRSAWRILPLNQLQMMKWMLNDVARHQYQPDTSRLLGFIFDGVARHTQEGLDFVARAQEVGWREAVRERDRPFGDYGERR